MKLAGFLFLACFFSLNAFAHYECDLDLSFAEESDIVVGEKVVKASSSEMRQKNEGTILEESLEDKISLKTFMTGWNGEEQAVLEIFRGSKSISEKFEMRGNEERTVWFDVYKLNVKCSIK